MDVSRQVRELFHLEDGAVESKAEEVQIRTVSTADEAHGEQGDLLEGHEERVKLELSVTW